MTSGGFVERRCACRDPETGKQLGKRCPRLASDRKHGRWYGRVYRTDPATGRRRGDQRVRGSFATKREAQEAVKRAAGRVAAGVRTPESMTYAEYLTSVFLPHGRRMLESGKWRPSTFNGYERRIRRDIVPALGAIPLVELSYDHLAAFADELAEEERGQSTRRAILNVVRSSLRTAKRQNRIVHNPAADLELPQDTKSSTEPWTASETVTFLEFARYDDLWPVWAFIAYTGCRRSEALGLRVSDMDLDRRAMHIQHGAVLSGGRVLLGQAKTAGWVGMSPMVVDLLTRRLETITANRSERGAAYQDHGLVFCRADGTPHWPDTVTRAFQRRSADAGLRTIRLHDLRHGVATLLHSHGVDLPMISKFVRHSSITTTNDIYAHLAPQVATDIAEVVDEAFERAYAELSGRVYGDTTTSRPHRSLRAV